MPCLTVIEVQSGCSDDEMDPKGCAHLIILGHCCAVDARETVGTRWRAEALTPPFATHVNKQRSKTWLSPSNTTFQPTSRRDFTRPQLTLTSGLQASCAGCVHLFNVTSPSASIVTLSGRLIVCDVTFIVVLVFLYFIRSTRSQSDYNNVHYNNSMYKKR